jgi:hypothetical protein
MRMIGLRQWLVRRIAGRMPVLLNARIDRDNIVLETSGAMVENCDIKGVHILLQADGMDGAVIDRCFFDGRIRQLLKLPEAVVLFHKGGVWTVGDGERWRDLTGREEATSRALCDFASELIAANAYDNPRS